MRTGAGLVRRSAEQWLREDAEGKGGLIRVARVAARGWALGSKFRRWAYEHGVLRAGSLPARHVVVVGNVTLGGSGKTPMVELLARAAAERGGTQARAPVLVLTRGYGEDEQYQLQANLAGSRCVVGVGRDRISVAERCLRDAGFSITDTAILDDGLQHFKVRRDVDVVMVNSIHGTKGRYGELVPLGTLREHWADAMQRATVVVLHHANLVEEEELARMEDFLRDCAHAGGNGNLRFFRSAMTPLRFFNIRNMETEACVMRETPVVTFNGIGCHEGFVRAVQNALPGKVFRSVWYPDHHKYEPSDLEYIKRMADGIGATLVTTEKDFHRSKGIFETKLGDRCLVAKSRLMILDGKEDDFTNLALRK